MINKFYNKEVLTKNRVFIPEKKEREVLCSLVTGGSTIKGVLGGDDCNITLYVTGQVGLCSHSVHKRAGWCVNSYTT